MPHGTRLPTCLKAPALSATRRPRPPTRRVLLLLRPHLPPGGGAGVAGRLALKELPGLAVGAEASLVGGGERGRVALLVGVEPSLRRRAGAQRPEPGRSHHAESRQLPGASQVDGAPNTAGLARCEPDDVARGVAALPDAVDPPEAQRRIHRLGPGDARSAGVLLVEPHPELRDGAVMALEPFAPARRRDEEPALERCPSGGRRHGARSSSVGETSLLGWSGQAGGGWLAAS